jgi:hypothetical protein
VRVVIQGRGKTHDLQESSLPVGDNNEGHWLAMFGTGKMSPPLLRKHAHRNKLLDIMLYFLQTRIDFRWLEISLPPSLSVSKPLRFNTRKSRPWLMQLDV